VTHRWSTGDDLITVADRIRWMQLCRVLTLAGLPILAVATMAPAPTVTRLTLLCGGWLGFAALTLLLNRAGRRAAILSLTFTLLGDGIVLALGWWWLGGLAGPVGVLVLLHTIAVTLVATFRSGVKLALWHSLLALVLLDAKSAGLLGPVADFPFRAASVYVGGLWAAVLGTACLAAVNERELRRRRYDEQALRHLALEMGVLQRPAAVAGALAEFALAELGARRAAVVVRSVPEFAAHLGPAGIAAVAQARGAGQVVRLPETTQLPPPLADHVSFRQTADGPDDAWLRELLPGALNVVLISFSAALQTGGVFVFELPRRRSQRFSRRVERRLVATARQAAAQSAAAVGRATAATMLEDAVNTDGLTGLANRAHFDARLAERVAGGEPFNLILVDLDHFKSVNDTYGHQAGDAVLRGTAAALRRASQPGDVVARYGGEELVVLAAGGGYEAALTAERLRRAVAEAETPVPVTASLGAATYPHEATTAEGLVERADQRLYVAKRSGRNRAVTSADEAFAAGTTWQLQS
jgi:two-component system, cell cycle response regulator